MTVVGPIAGVVDGKVGSTPYKFMLMNATGYKRWNVVQQVVMPPQPIDVDAGSAPLGLRLWRLGLVQSRPGTGSDHSNRVNSLFIGKRNSGSSAVSALTWI